MSFQYSTYEPELNLDDACDNDGFLTTSTTPPPPYSQKSSSHIRRRLWHSQLIIAANTILLLLSLITFCGIIIFGHQEAEINCIRKTSTYCTFNHTPKSQKKLITFIAPIFDQVPIQLTTKSINGTFWPQETPSLFQQRPSPEVDAAWDRISDTHGIVVTRSNLLQMGVDPSESWPWPESDAPSGSYMGMLDVFHQAHCLNIMRRAIFTEYYGNMRETRKNERFPFEEHVLHCQYILLQNIMCHADLEVVTFNKVKGVPGPFANFNVDRKCRNFDDVLAWKEKNQIDPKNLEEWKKTPEGIKELDDAGIAVPYLRSLSKN
jgi:hypothetical protein